MDNRVLIALTMLMVLVGLGLILRVIDGSTLEKIVYVIAGGIIGGNVPRAVPAPPRLHRQTDDQSGKVIK